MIVTVKIEDGDDISECTINFAKSCPPAIHELRLLHALLKQANVNTTLARLFAGAVSLGIDVYLENHFKIRSKTLQKKFIETLDENPGYRAM